MYGPHVDVLRLYKRQGFSLGKPQWMRQGDQGNRWIQGEYTVEHTGNVQVRFSLPVYIYAEFIFIVNTPVIDRHITYLYRNVYCDIHNERLIIPLLVNTLDLCRVCFQQIMYLEYFLSPVNVLVSEENSQIKKKMYVRLEVIQRQLVLC